MRPSELTTFLAAAIPARLPVLITGAPGIGKSDIVAQASAPRDICDRMYVMAKGQLSPQWRLDTAQRYDASRKCLQQAMRDQQALSAGQVRGR